MQCMAAGYSVEVARDYTCDQVCVRSEVSQGGEKADCCGQGACIHNTNKCGEGRTESNRNHTHLTTIGDEVGVSVRWAMVS